MSVLTGAIGLALVFLGIGIRERTGSNHGNLVAVFGSGLAALGSALAHEHVGMGAWSLCSAVWIWIWWTGGGGKDLKKAARELGDESRQRIQALVNALQPAPAGAAA